MTTKVLSRSKAQKIRDAQRKLTEDYQNGLRDALVEGLSAKGFSAEVEDYFSELFFELDGPPMLNDVWIIFATVDEGTRFVQQFAEGRDFDDWSLSVQFNRRKVSTGYRLETSISLHLPPYRVVRLVEQLTELSVG